MFLNGAHWERKRSMEKVRREPGTAWRPEVVCPGPVASWSASFALSVSVGLKNILKIENLAKSAAKSSSNLLLVVNVDFVEWAASIGAGALASDGEGFAVR
jgi:hypothetical protein